MALPHEQPYNPDRPEGLEDPETQAGQAGSELVLAIDSLIRHLARRDSSLAEMRDYDTSTAITTLDNFAREQIRRRYAGVRLLPVTLSSLVLKEYVTKIEAAPNSRAPLVREWAPVAERSAHVFPQVYITRGLFHELRKDNDPLADRAADLLVVNGQTINRLRKLPGPQIDWRHYGV